MDDATPVGFASRDVTPAAPAAMSGFAVRDDPSRGVHDPLYVRVLIVGDGTDRAGVVVFDLIGVDARLSGRVRAGITSATGIGADRVVVAATHTHGGPAVLDRARLGAADEAYRRRLVDLAVEAARGAAAAVRPLRIGYAVGHEATVARNRRVADGPIDPAVRTLAFTSGDAVAGILASYACHPVTLGPDNRLLTRDYPGFVVDALQRAAPGAFPAFLTGVCGQVNTGHDAYASQHHGHDPRRSFGEAARIGDRIAAAALDAVGRGTRPVRGPVRLARAEALLPYRPLARDPRDDARAWRSELARAGSDDPARAALLTACLAWAESHPGTVPAAAAGEVAVLAVGPLALAFYPGEVFVEYGLDLARAFPDRLVIPVGYAHDAPGYLPRPDAFPHGGYEVDEAFRFYGAPASFAPEAAENVQRAMMALMRATSA